MTAGGDEATTDRNGLEATVHRTTDGMDASQLNNLVQQSDGGTLFHRHEWLAAVEEGLAGEARHVVVRTDGNPVGLLANVATAVPLPDGTDCRVADRIPLQYVAPPPPGYGGPVVAGDTGEVLARLLDPALLPDGTTLFHRVQSYESDALGYARTLEAMGYDARLAECTFFIDLRKDWETILGEMSSSRRRAVRNAVDQEFSVEIEPLGADLSRTYDRYHANVDRVGGDRLPRAFLAALAERLPDRVRVFTATVDGREVGRYVYLLDDEGGVLHHWLSAIGDSDDFDRYPSELLHREAIRWGIDRGYDRYSFGPVEPHYDNSVYRFKRRYGGTPVQSYRWERGHIPVAWRAYNLARTWFRRSQIDAG
ncbi:GNAT family N-acetyltransferase (plasmid) [Halobaculum sp. CBA1158]|uniref:GNAT family N-acetyltransferase n=1 Tax=Halobaculum sp. CBA1158 TaxID=2904243 RepID=UPI001F334D24|nr:GNAT family N-acetyltransferase [Halobaculum sp. CBA1158]UIP01457.1 GNAT family N-acetyltransferase [Halobaculum sp. CBA1158]